MKNLSPTAAPYTGANSDNAGSLAATINFPGVPVVGKRLSLHLRATGTPTGTFKLQTSFDNTNWVDTPNAAAEFTSQPAGATYELLANWTNVPGSMWRLVYTRTSGTGTLNSYWAQGN